MTSQQAFRLSLAEVFCAATDAQLSTIVIDCNASLAEQDDAQVRAVKELAIAEMGKRVARAARNAQIEE